MGEEAELTTNKALLPTETLKEIDDLVPRLEGFVAQTDASAHKVGGTVGVGRIDEIVAHEQLLLIAEDDAPPRRHIDVLLHPLRNVGHAPGRVGREGSHNVKGVVLYEQPVSFLCAGTGSRQPAAIRL